MSGKSTRVTSVVALTLSLILVLSGCDPKILFGAASPQYPQPTLPSPEKIPELAALPDLPTWEEFKKTTDDAIAYGEKNGSVTNHDRLDSIVAKLDGADHDDPGVRLVMRTVMRAAVNQSQEPATVDAAGKSSSATLTWTSCGADGLECASLQVPLDYDKPDGPTIDIAIDRYKATDPSKRIGIMLSNPGGPGGSGVDFLPGWYGDLSPEIKASFDVMSFDPRGVGQSAPVICGQPDEPFAQVDSTPETQKQEKAYAKEAAKFASACKNGAGDLLGNVGSRDVAQDMDEIRKAMNEDQISYVGYSYGTVIGQVYANMFPKQVRALVLDGVVDTAKTKQSLSSVQSKAFDNALRRFAKSCQKVCNGLAQYVGQKAADEPIDSKFVDEKVDDSAVQVGILGTLYSAENWPLLSWALREAAVNKDGTLLALARDNYAGVSIFDGQNAGGGGGDDSYFAVMCGDFAVTSLDTAFAMSRSDNRLHPVFAQAPDVLCNEWKPKADPIGAITWPAKTPILLVSTTGDPATPHSMGQAVAARNPSAVLLTHNGDGHTVYARGNKCIDPKVDAFLLKVTLPAKAIVCGD